MYSVLKNVIMSGNFVLSDMYNKIDTMWIKGKITEEEAGAGDETAEQLPVV